jgi:PAS domain S-box-containing protein
MGQLATRDDDRARSAARAMLIAVTVTCLACGKGNSADILNVEERTWLTQNRSHIVLATETGYAPFVFVGAHGRPTGLAEEHMQLIESKLGVQFERKPYASLDDILSGVRRDEVQIVNALTQTPERATYLVFTKPFISVPNVIIVRKERPGHLRESDLSGLTVSLVRSYAVTEHLAQGHVGLVPDLVADDLSALVNVAFGRSDATVVDLATASYLIEHKGITNLRVAGEVDRDIQLAIGTPKSDPLLHVILQKGMDATTDSERRQIRDRWINPSGRSILSDWRVWLAVGGALGAILAGIAIVMVWNRTLRRKVSARTEELAKQKEQVAVTLHSIANGVISTDLDGRVTSMNAAAERLCGWSTTEATGLALETVLVYDEQRDREALRVALGSPLDSCTTLFSADPATIASKTGVKRRVVTSAAPIRSRAGAPCRGAVFVVQDVTERAFAEAAREKLEVQLRQAQKMEAIGHLAGGVAHDFNNLLQVIMGNLELARVDLPNGAPEGASLKDAMEAAQRAAELTQQLLAFGRRQVIQPIELDFNALIEGVVRMIRRVIGASIELVFRPGDGLGTVRVDKGQFEQVLMNLCINARDAMPDGGTLTLSTENANEPCGPGTELSCKKGGPHVLLRVIDTGTGMSEATRAQIFEPFFTTKGVGKGTGLGLATVYGIITQHNCSIVVQSEPGKGTTFELYIPIVPEAAAEAKPH